ncbi:hypothetical protein CVT26_011944 [Gymnopilus dilepis]|uniref:Uncharacterized protein n=1 Tax=Gymnopilus dilepis TaxID=231916 RepID=A0A409VYE4_9AGAR|nr:hypothetical protein CVT26_011944 [Gymnopilus dilepis]
MRYHQHPHTYHPHVVRPARRGRDVMSIQNLINHDEDTVTAVQPSSYTAPTPTTDMAHPKKSTFSLRPITAAGWKNSQPTAVSLSMAKKRRVLNTSRRTAGRAPTQNSIKGYVNSVLKPIEEHDKSKWGANVYFGQPAREEPSTTSTSPIATPVVSTPYNGLVRDTFSDISFIMPIPNVSQSTYTTTPLPKRQKKSAMVLPPAPQLRLHIPVLGMDTRRGRRKGKDHDANAVQWRPSLYNQRTKADPSEFIMWAPPQS